MKRDNFTQCDKETLKDRVGGRCSNPLCMRDNVGPKANMGSSVSVGEAAHIYAASEGGPRFNPGMSEVERRSIENGIWLCSACHTLIDSDPDRYPPELLKKWKADAEYAQLCRLNGVNFSLNNTYINEKQRSLQAVKKNLDSLHERLMYAYKLWESNFSRYFNKNDLQNEIDSHWILYQENLKQIYEYNDYAYKLNEELKNNSLLIGQELSGLILLYLDKIYFCFSDDSIGLYCNYWSQFFEMLKNNFETLSAIKENFDKTCFASYPNNGSIK